jgi:hypothetical protein
MPLNIGYQPQIRSQAELNSLIEQARHENKRAVVVARANGHVVKVIEKNNAISEFLRRVSGQTSREEARLNAFKLSLPAQAIAVGAQAGVADALRDALHHQPDESHHEQGPQAQRQSQPEARAPTPASVSTPAPAPTAASAQPQAAPGVTAATSAQAKPKPPRPLPTHTDSPTENPSLYATRPPFGTGGIVKGHYVQRQFGECCLAHALSSYFAQPVFGSREEFLAYRNVSYDRVLAPGGIENQGVATQREHAAIKLDELSEVAPTLDLLNRLQTDPAKSQLSLSEAPWVYSEFRWPDPGKDQSGKYRPLDSAKAKTQLDALFNFLAEKSHSQRFIVRTGGGGGHFLTLVHDRDPAKSPDQVWTLLNSSYESDNFRLPRVQSGSSPAELLGAHTTRGLVLSSWTQSDDPSANLGEIFNIMKWVPPEKVGVAQAAASGAAPEHS